MTESTCCHCQSRIWWVPSEARWVSASNDHSWCPYGPDHKHQGEAARSPWMHEGGPA